MQGEATTRARRGNVVHGTVEGKRSRLQRLIAGVRTRAACSVAPEQNPLCGIVRLDESILGAPGAHGGSGCACREVYLTTLAPGGMSAWHLHRVHEDSLFVASGRVRIVLYDAREGSRTAGVLNQFCVGGRDRQVIVVPPGVCHGLRNEGDTEALIVSLPMAPNGVSLRDHGRMAKQTPAVPFDWQAENER
jgi:oxalate decarboxylase/phosphoglucose isomerase-like protein (cupin superfamily)